MGFSNYWRNAILDHVFGRSTYTAPTIYVGLSTDDPGDDGSGLAEPSGGEYARVATASSDWADAAAFSITNSMEIAFPQATSDWGTITYFALFDAASGGNMLMYAALTSSLSVVSTNYVRFVAGNLVVTH